MLLRRPPTVLATLLWCGLTVSLLTGCSGCGAPSDVAWFESSGPPPYKLYQGIDYSSRYLTMRDGTKIAIDLYLPAGLEKEEKIPTLLLQTRYIRSLEPRSLLRWLRGGEPIDMVWRSETRKEFLRHGYAWVVVDVRGSGASYGKRLYPFSRSQIRDGAEVIDWIIDQPWSNGKIGTLGISYEGYAAEFTLLNQHPAVKAVVARASGFDTYTDIAFPGGIPLTWLTKTWQELTFLMDRNRIGDIGPWWLRPFIFLLIKGIQPVEDDPDRSLLAGAIEEHRDNYRVHEDASEIVFRDDISDPQRERLREEGVVWSPEMGGIDLFSPHRYVEELERSGVPIYGYTGWFDGGFSHGAIKRFLTVKNPGSRLTIGPWSHVGVANISPYRSRFLTGFDHDQELIRFFDLYLKGIDRGVSDEKPVHYFTMGDEEWKVSDTWPPAGSQRVPFYLGEGNRLTRDLPAGSDRYDLYRVDLSAGTGDRSRWNSLVNIYLKPIGYPDREEEDEKLLTYTSAPLEGDTEVTGHPIMTVYVASTATDGQFFVYLEDVDEEGDVHYVTEGMLRAIHRKLSDEEPPYKMVVPYRTFKRKDAMPLVPGEVAELTFDLLPTSYVFKQGHSIRIALAGADKDHFAVPDGPPPTWQVYRSALYPSHIDLPIIPR